MVFSKTLMHVSLNSFKVQSTVMFDLIISNFQTCWHTRSMKGSNQSMDRHGSCCIPRFHTQRPLAFGVAKATAKPQVWTASSATSEPGESRHEWHDLSIHLFQLSDCPSSPPARSGAWRRRGATPWRLSDMK